MSVIVAIRQMFSEKRQYRRYKARSRQLPPEYQSAITAIERYVMFLGPADGTGAVTMLDDLVDLFEQSAANGAPVRAVVGEDPIDFVETFIRNYPKGQWILREQERLVAAIERAESGSHDRSNREDAGGPQ